MAKKKPSLRLVVDDVGLTAFSQAVGVSPQVVSNWIRRRIVPADQCLAVERAADGRLSRYDLRPDIFGLAPRQDKAA